MAEYEMNIKYDSIVHVMSTEYEAVTLCGIVKVWMLKDVAAAMVIAPVNCLLCLASEEEPPVGW